MPRLQQLRQIERHRSMHNATSSPASTFCLRSQPALLPGHLQEQRHSSRRLTLSTRGADRDALRPTASSLSALIPTSS